MPSDQDLISKLSQASVTDLSAKMDNVRYIGRCIIFLYLHISQSSQGQAPDLSILKGILGKLGGGEDKLSQGEEIKKQSQAYNFDPDNIAPPEVQRQLLELLKWHDDIFRNVNEKIEMVPGLTNLMDEFSNALNECATSGSVHGLYIDMAHQTSTLFSRLTLGSDMTFHIDLVASDLLFSPS